MKQKLIYLMAFLFTTLPLLAQDDELDEGPEGPPAAPIDDYIPLLALIGILFVFYMLYKRNLALKGE